MAGEGSPLRLERDGAVALVTLDDPARRNALTDELLGELAPLLARLDDDGAVRCIVIAGADKVFASGADVRALLERTPHELYDGDRARHWEALRTLRTPTVAAVSGYCLGGGCELAMTCDLVVAAPSVRFGLPETQLGLIPGAGGTQLLPRAIGRALAMDMILTGRLLDAAEAERAGLVSRIAPEGEWRALALEVAQTIAGRPATAQRLAREAVATAHEVGLRAGIGVERRAFALAFGHADAREGLTAFLEKRRPRWEQDD
ncbi:enoyl-CoA hydratase-related protein [Conexibacter sp. CPCC 206217]|uniref:enoyl-CoA hydratase-related protein n=1 Tax=Conexibacter sp. CPCC 206217 TaxID=3064574 RepID=UPI0027257D04|nr:enoyl-CoA hydratase-related protein [Conexibacter sp. CPCC 206217]MDO8212582.1 enoyl-CoA hydratase-related protein [Conexibacter sp. CPCC 206217]